MMKIERGTLCVIIFKLKGFSSSLEMVEKEEEEEEEEERRTGRVLFCCSAVVISLRG